MHRRVPRKSACLPDTPTSIQCHACRAACFSVREALSGLARRAQLHLGCVIAAIASSPPQLEAAAAALASLHELTTGAEAQQALAVAHSLGLEPPLLLTQQLQERLALMQHLVGSSLAEASAAAAAPPPPPPQFPAAAAPWFLQPGGLQAAGGVPVVQAAPMQLEALHLGPSQGLSVLGQMLADAARHQREAAASEQRPPGEAAAVDTSNSNNSG